MIDVPPAASLRVWRSMLVIRLFRSETIARTGS
jgi:hypothetical protein